MNKKPTVCKPLVHIKDWFFEYSGSVLYGNVVDHPHFEEGEYVHTSTVLSYDRDTGIVETKNTVYVLDEDE